MQEKKFLLEGWKLAEEAIRSPFGIERVVVQKEWLERSDHERFLGAVVSKNIPMFEAGERELSAISDTEQSQGIVLVLHQRQLALEESLRARPNRVVALDRVADPGNLGSIIRSCDWFGVNLLLLSGGCVELYNEKVVRSTAGSILRVHCIEHVDLLEALGRLRREGSSVFCLAADATEAYDHRRYEEPWVIVLGSEAHGVSAELRTLSDAVVSIPRFGAAESLNVGVACGIMLAHLRKASPRDAAVSFTSSAKEKLR